ncbi:MAG: RrF2 family transcriptional regulator [Candidatus Bipolaricaulia bacterium]
MKLSKKGEYALRALMDLAFHYGNGVEPSQEIAENGQIPKSFLEQILITLKNAQPSRPASSSRAISRNMPMSGSVRPLSRSSTFWRGYPPWSMGCGVSSL